MDTLVSVLVAGLALPQSGDGMPRARETLRVEGGASVDSALGIMVAGRRLPARLYPAISWQGSDLDAFALFVAPTLQAHVQATEHEVCALVCRLPGGFAIQPVSVHAHLLCPVPRLCPAGTSPTALTIHAHTLSGSFKANRADLALLSPGIQVGARVVAGDPDRFSREDFEGGPGYLVGRRSVWFQSGARQVRRVGALPHPLPTAPPPPR